MATIICNPETLATLRGIISEVRARSAWSRGVNAYALDILDELEEYANYEFDNTGVFPPLSESLALNGADDWFHYAAGGCGAALIYADDIAERLCAPYELRIYQKRGGDTIEWQGRALFQAWRVITVACSNLA